MKHPVDVHVGRRVRERRRATGMTQQKLATKIGTAFQQIQKYETGANRMAASRLWEVAAALEVPVSFFFDGMAREEPGVAAEHGDILVDKEALDLVKMYYVIPSPQRRGLLNLARVLGGAD